MTKMHFTRAAEMVDSIRQGGWTHDAPSFADGEYDGMPYSDPETADYTRAVQTAEAFILLFLEYNPRFNEQKFLQACGLVEQPAKRSKVRSTDDRPAPLSPDGRYND